MEYNRLIILLVVIAASVVWWVLLWFCTRSASAYDLAAGKTVRIHTWYFYDSNRNIRNTRSYEAYIADVAVEGLCAPGDVLLCETRDAVPGAWCIWWDVITGPYVCLLTEEDCVGCVNQKLPLIMYTISHEQA